jgi:succinylarginine dihydrolase
MLGVVTETVLAIGGNIGGANVFVYGVRVSKRGETPAPSGARPPRRQGREALTGRARLTDAGPDAHPTVHATQRDRGARARRERCTPGQ